MKKLLTGSLEFFSSRYCCAAALMTITAAVVPSIVPLAHAQDLQDNCDKSVTIEQVFLLEDYFEAEDVCGNQKLLDKNGFDGTKKYRVPTIRELITAYRCGSIKLDVKINNYSLYIFSSTPKPEEAPVRGRFNGLMQALEFNDGFVRDFYAYNSVSLASGRRNVLLFGACVLK